MWWNNTIAARCNYIDQATCEPKAPSLHLTITIVVYFVCMVYGVLNNSVSLVIFFNKRYDNRFLSLLLRCFYVCNLFAVIFQPVSITVDIHVDSYCLSTDHLIATINKVLRMVMTVAWEMSYAILALMALARILYSFCPFSAPHLTLGKWWAVVIVILSVLATIVAFNVTDHVILYSGSTSRADAGTQEMVHRRLFLLVLLALTVSFNIVAVLMDKCVQARRTSSQSSHVVARLHVYLFISTIWSTVTTLPFVLHGVLPDTMAHVQPLTKGYCTTFYIIGVTFVWLVFLNLCTDNTLYALLSPKYREEAKTAFSNLWGRVADQGVKSVGSVMFTVFPTWRSKENVADH